jgi:membrane protease YdiL (CAAX protease family)
LGLGEDLLRRASLLEWLLGISSYVGIFLVSALFLWWEGRSLSSIGLRTTTPLLEWARGLGLGILMLAASVGISALPGFMAFERLGGAGDTTDSLALWLLSWLVFFVIQGPGEEVLCRGYLLPVLGARGGPWAGIAISSLIFAVLHLLNPNIGPISVLNLVLVGIFFCLYALKEGGLWGVFGWHTAWNWAQGNLFGLEVSGMADIATHPLFDLTETGPDWITGGSFGPEGGVAVTAVLLAGTIFLLWRFWRARTETT